jgi:SAM-dependent methyltransferase
VFKEILVFKEIKDLVDEDYDEDNIFNPVVLNNLREFQPKGRVLCVGEQKSFKEEWLKEFPNSVPITVDIVGDPDILTDVCIRIPTDEKFDFVYCQAVLEHVVAPTVAIKHCFDVCKSGAIGVFHTHPPGYGVHRHPVDCWRMMYDTPNVIADYLGLELVKKIYFFYGCGPHVVFVLRKPSELNVEK